MLSDGGDLTYMESALKATEMKQMANKITLAALNKLYSRKCALKREIWFFFVCFWSKSHLHWSNMPPNGVWSYSDVDSFKEVICRSKAILTSPASKWSVINQPHLGVSESTVKTAVIDVDQLFETVSKVGPDSLRGVRFPHSQDLYELVNKWTF